MNEHDQSTPPPLPVETAEMFAVPDGSPGASNPKPARPLGWWLKKLFACNPFYLVSAALLLFGCYRVSMDAPFLNLELARLWFNFSAVQIYEILVVGTAIFLTRRKLWYDSTLLVWLENLLIFVPFILISQAAFIDSQLALAMSLGGGLLVAVRSSVLRRIPPHLPCRALVAGFILLALNLALPLIYRHFGETKIGVTIASGPAYEMNEFTWLLILPAALALASFLPLAPAEGNLPSPDRWQPVGLFALWLAVTSVHVYSLDYIYQFDLRPELFAPAAWVLAWMLWLRLSAPVVWMKHLRYVVMAAAICVPLLAASAHNHHTFLILAALNLVACGGACFVEYGHRLARHLTFAAGVMFIAGLPDQWMNFVVPGLSPHACVFGIIVAYPLWLIIRSRNPKLAVLGSLMFASLAGSWIDNRNAAYWAVQAGLIFLLLHSLRWNDAAHTGAKTIRILAALFWVTDSILWVDSGAGQSGLACLLGLSTLTVYVLVELSRGKWSLPVIPASAMLVTVSSPGVTAVETICALPLGLVAVLGSFLLFGFGTAVALTRPHWHPAEQKPHPMYTQEPAGPTQ